LFLLDGHHRWASGLEEDEDQVNDAWMINLPMEGLLNKVSELAELHKAAKTVLQYAYWEGYISEENYKGIQEIIS
jgi:hypothetical protein